MYLRVRSVDLVRLTRYPSQVFNSKTSIVTAAMLYNTMASGTGLKYLSVRRNCACHA
jgi:hypothetical protein